MRRLIAVSNRPVQVDYLPNYSLLKLILRPEVMEDLIFLLTPLIVSDTIVVDISSIDVWFPSEVRGGSANWIIISPVYLQVPY